MLTLEELVAHIREQARVNSEKSSECLRRKNQLGYDAYIERAIALGDILTWVEGRQS